MMHPSWIICILASAFILSESDNRTRGKTPRLSYPMVTPSTPPPQVLPLPPFFETRYKEKSENLNNEDKSDYRDNTNNTTGKLTLKLGTSSVSGSPSSCPSSPVTGLPPSSSPGSPLTAPVWSPLPRSGSQSPLLKGLPSRFPVSGPPSSPSSPLPRPLPSRFSSPSPPSPLTLPYPSSPTSPFAKFKQLESEATKTSQRLEISPSGSNKR